MKRQRVSIACQKCRALKTKCDGQKPVCGRCMGYGFDCSWFERRKSDVKTTVAEIHANAESSVHHGFSLVVATPPDMNAMRRTAELYETLISSLQTKLDGPERAAFDLKLESIRNQIPTGRMSRITEKSAECLPSTHPTRSPIYLGKASDIWFFNSIREFMREQDTIHFAEENDTQSYDQSEHGELWPASGQQLDFPSKNVAIDYLDIYFSTIHIAYPFLCKSTVVGQFERIWQGSPADRNDRVWLALLNSIFAIGAYYTSFPCTDASKTSMHLTYFEQALSFSNQLMATSTMTNIWVLLTQCFFLLAISQNDRCWNTLGLAMRMGQSIGLHIDLADPRKERQVNVKERELRRRAWYSMYVLDRLLALQLGRPVAIHKQDFDVRLPSRDENPLSESDQPPQASAASDNAMRSHHNGEDANTPSKRDKSEAEGPSVMDYFLCVIRFSHILGQVIGELYQPTQVECSPNKILSSTSSLDNLLCQWKLSLPRHLRFDLGHTFENSITFKRQRNMLAIKFHHLRALIYRPFLCLAWLERDNPPFMDLLRSDRSRLEQAERICILEAQQTAHLLHHIVDERCLVHDFPWWQMISCLLCASSILLVASAFFDENTRVAGSLMMADAMTREELGEDAETCLKVFEALSINSAAASKATEMLKSLKDLRAPSSCFRYSMPPWSPSNEAMSHASTLLSPPPQLSSVPPVTNVEAAPYSASEIRSGSEDSWWNQWPGGMSDTMEWSARFLYQN